MSDQTATQETIVHGVYSYKLNSLDESGNPKYVVVYLENDISDVRITGFEKIANLDNIPTIDYDNDNLLKFLEVTDAETRKALEGKLATSETTKTATPNKILYLDSAGKLQATVKNAESLGGISFDKYALLTDLQSSTWTLDEVLIKGFTPLTNLDSIPAPNYNSDTLMQFLKILEATIRKLDRDKLEKSETTTTASPNKILYLNSAGKLPATALKADADGSGQNISKTYIKALSVSGTTITYIRGDGTTGTITTQDNNTTYTKGTYNYLGLIKPSKSYTGAATLTTAAATATTAPKLAAISTNSDRYYAVEMDTNGVPFVNVPWKDTNTDTNVTNTLNTTVKAYVTGTTAASTNTGTQVFDTGVYISANSGELVATKFTGPLNGNANTATSATTATKATQDSAGQQINKTYIKTLSVSGTTITYTKGDGTTGTLTTQDTNTDTKVTNTLATTTKAYVTGTTTATTNTGTQVFDTGVYLGTTAGELVATKFTGALNGTAAKATADGSGNTISSTYAKKTDVPSVWDSNGHLVSPAGWTIWITNE